MKTIAGLVTLMLAVWCAPGALADPAVAPETTKTVHRAYGDGPVRLGRATHLEVLFEGRRGDQVRLGRTVGCQVSLRGPDGESVQRKPSGFWRLTAPGPHLFTLTRCGDLEGSTRVLLEKLRHVAVRTDAAEGAFLPAERGFVDAFRVRIPASGRLQVKVLGSTWPHGIAGMVLPNGAWYPFNGLISGDTLYFEDGRPVASQFGRLRGAGGSGALVTQAGDRVILVAHGRLTAFASVAQPVPVAVDATATPLAPSVVPYRQYQVEFDAVVGDWVHAEIVNPTSVAGGNHDWQVLLGPNGHQFDRPTYWRIPTTGRYRFMVPTAPTTETTQVRIRTIRQVDPVPVDGTHVSLSTSEPGEWVVAPLTLDPGALYEMTRHEVSATGPWVAEATIAYEQHCPRRANGCGEWSSGTVSPDARESAQFGLSDQFVVLLKTGAAVSASVALSVSPAS